MSTLGFDQDYDAGFELPTQDSEEQAHSYYTVSEEGVTPQTSDDFWGNAFDEDEVTQALKADLPPEGDYTGSGLQSEKRKNRFEGFPEVRYYGMVENAEGRKAKTSFTITPKKLYKDNGKVRWEYQMYKQCLQAFIKANGRQPSNGEEFDQFMATATLVHRITHNLKGTGVNTMGIRAAN